MSEPTAPEPYTLYGIATAVSAGLAAGATWGVGVLRKMRNGRATPGPAAGEPVALEAVRTLVEAMNARVEKNASATHAVGMELVRMQERLAGSMERVNERIDNLCERMDEQKVDAKEDRNRLEQKIDLFLKGRGGTA